MSALCFLLVLQIGFLDVELLPSITSFSTTFHTNCGRGKDLGTAKYLETAVGEMQRHAPL